MLKHIYCTYAVNRLRLIFQALHVARLLLNVLLSRTDGHVWAIQCIGSILKLKLLFLTVKITGHDFNLLICLLPELKIKQKLDLKVLQIL